MTLWTAPATFPSSASLQAHLVFGILIGIVATIVFVSILFQMERQNSIYKAILMESILGERDTQLELEEEIEDASYNRTTTTTANNNNLDQDQSYVQAGNDGEYNNNTSFQMPTDTNIPATTTTSSLSSFHLFYKPGDTRHRALTWYQKCAIVLHVFLLLLINYLILVFLPGNNVWICGFTVILIWIVTLHPYLLDEILRRKRLDRVLLLMALFLFLAGSFTLITYCQLSMHEGSIYQGPARILGYDESLYHQDASNEQVVRADLEVTWGGSWGCPNQPTTQCVGTVNGVLCETQSQIVTSSNNNDEMEISTEEEVEEEDDDDSNKNRYSKHRILANHTNTATTEIVVTEKNQEANTTEQEEIKYKEELDEEYTEAVEEIADEAEIEVEVYEKELDKEFVQEEEALYEGALSDDEIAENVYDIAEMEANENEELSYEKDELEAENEELEEELVEEEVYEEELEDLVEDLEEGSSYDENYYFGDDNVFDDDSYWSYDWGSVWGEYACGDLFNADLEGESFESDQPPGNDQWPTIEIYGSCNTCKAYIVDYYSTEHFRSIKEYELQSRIYFWMGFLGLILAAFAALVQRVRPTQEKEIVLLTHDGGVST